MNYKKNALIMGSSILIIGITIAGIMIGEGSFSQAEEKGNSYCIDNWDADADIDKDSLYHDYLMKTLAENIKNEDGIRDCKIDVNYANGEIVSAKVSIDAENDEPTISETNILDYISQSLEISTEDIALSFD